MAYKQGNNYDGSYKHLFAHPEMVESLMKHYVPEDWVQEINFSTLEKRDKSYVSDDLRERHDDIIWRVKWRDTWCYVYLLIEFQSNIDPWMALRIMVYTGLLYQDLIKCKEVREGELLPPVFPLVLYNGLVRWTAKQDIAELIKPVPKGLAKYRPSQCYFLLDEGRVSEDELLPGKDLTSKLIRMEKSQSPEVLQLAIKDLIIQLKGPEYASLRRAFAVWIHRVLLRRMVPKESFPEAYDLEEVDAMLAERVTQWTEQWKNEGIKQGHKEGHEQGHEQGQKEGQTALLDRLLRKRFESAYDLKKQKLIQEASLEQLAIWAERMLDAASIEDVFRGK